MDYYSEEEYIYECDSDYEASVKHCPKQYDLDIKDVFYINKIYSNTDCHFIGFYFENIHEYIYIKINEYDDGFQYDCVCDGDYKPKKNSVYHCIIKDKIKIKLLSLNFLFTEIMELVYNSTNVCLMCQTKLPCTVSKPMVCDKERCVYQLSELGLGYSLDHYLMNSLDVTELILNIYKSTMSINKSQFYVEKPDFVTDEMDTIIKDLKIGELTVHAENNNLRPHLYEIHPSLYNTLQWLVSGNRCYITKTSEDESEKLVDCPQYTIHTLSPEKESVFQKNAKQYGTVLLFHGSPLYCWHSIIRNGLKVFSKTKYQANGAAHGVGIYFSKNFSTAYSYSTNKPTEYKCIAVCEVVNRYKDGGYCTVVTREEDIKIKYLFVSKVNIKQFSLNDLKYKPSINHTSIDGKL